MARSKKKGLDYFPFDVDFFSDIKVRKLIRHQGGKAVAVYACLLCEIYRNGYYIGRDNELAFILSEILGYNETYIQNVINDLLALGLIDRDMYNENNILTSVGIQKRYMEISSIVSHRKYVISEYCLIESENLQEKTEVLRDETEVLRRKTDIPRRETDDLRRKSAQRKVKERKVKEIKETSGTSREVPCRQHVDPPDPIDFNSLIDWFNETTKGVFGRLRLPLSKMRADMIKARIREHGKETFCEVIRLAMASDFLKGQNNRLWKATFDWMIKPSNFDKILTGNYDNKQQPGTGESSDESLLRSVAAGLARAKHNQENGS
jgi:hypothetical protein